VSEGPVSGWVHMIVVLEPGVAVMALFFVRTEAEEGGWSFGLWQTTGVSPE
jgi:hypothetical protein